MPDAIFRFYGNLNDFLPRTRRGVAFVYSFTGRVAVKDAIESIGVPHPEIGLLTANAVPVSFSHHLQEGDRIAAYPAFRDIDVSGISLARPPALASLTQFRFVLDTHLGRLAAYLRLAGFDTVYGHDWGDERLAETSSRERRILLTRDAGLLKRSVVEHGFWIRNTDPRRQLAEISGRLDLPAHLRPFSRCLRCNTPIVAVAKADVLGRLLPRTREHYHDFWTCPGCSRVYWKGGHYERLREVLRSSE